MKKDKLIEILSQIEGNPDIYLWNGIAEDWVDIEEDMVEMNLYRWSKDHVKSHIHFEMLRDACEKFNLSFEERSKVETEEFLKEVEEVVEKRYKEHYSGWDLPNEFVDEVRMKQWYDKSKPCYVLNHKIKGKSVDFIRGGGIDY